MNDIVSIDSVDRVAKAAAERGEALNDACPWPFDSPPGRRFKQTYFLHRAALQALAQEPKS